MSAKKRNFPQQHQSQPGKEHKMHPEPEVVKKNYRSSDKLRGKIALITGGDSGIGRSVAVHFAKEGADVAIIYLNETKDAKATKKMVESEGRKCLLIKGDLKKEPFCKAAVKKVSNALGRVNILVNNAAMQFPQDRLEDITAAQLKKTFESNVYPYFIITKLVVAHMKKGDTIINTSSVTAYRGSDHLLDYSSTKGAIISFTRSLSTNLAKQGIRVNAVAPGPIWTPLIPASFDEVATFGQDTPMGRAGQPSEVGPAYVFLASDDSSYMTGQVLHINGGEIIGG